MKILLAHNNYNFKGGAEVFYHETGRVLQEHKHKIAFFSIQDEDTFCDLWSDYFPKKAEYSTGNIFSRVIKFPQMVYSFEAKRKIAKLIEDFKPDLIHAFGIYVGLTPAIFDAAHLANVPLVMSCNDYKHICPNYKLYHHGHPCDACKGGRFHKAVVNRCCHDSAVYSIASAIEGYTHHWLNIYRKNIHTFLFASEFMAKKTEEFWGKNAFRWRLLRNPFDSTKYSISNKFDDFVLYFGRLIDEKGVHILIRAIAEAPETHLKIIGDGPQKTELQKICSDLKLDNVEFVGQKWGEELDMFLHRCRFVVVPSMWHENFPYVILQSFAMGKAVIASDRGGMPELITHGIRGLVYPAEDISVLTKCIQELWHKPELAVKMGREAKVFADSEFNDVKFYENLMRIYKGVLS